ncbi:MAG: hypothetical protein HQK83_08250, partial [Fibrobacteria bacterium]|nr:hypothetical protein [Fibrobacteria bacterium]
HTLGSHFLLCFYLILVLFFIPQLCLADNEDNVDYSQPSLFILQEAGMVQSGIYDGFFTDDWVDHFGAFWTQQATVNERLIFTVGLGGSFQFPKPEVNGGGWNTAGNSLSKAFFIGPTQADFSYQFGDLDSPYLTAGMGIFTFKYNSDAVNLGEYLFRSNPYPNYLYTGGYSILNSASAYLQGAKVQWSNGGLSLTGLLLTETTIAPLYDPSFALIANYKNDFLDIGFGVNFKRFFSLKSKRTRPTERFNGYISHQGEDYTLLQDYYKERINFYNLRYDKDTALANTFPQEATKYQQQAQQSLANQQLWISRLDTVRKYGGYTVDSLKYNIQDAIDRFLDSATIASYRDELAIAEAVPKPDVDYYTASGTIIMAKVAIDPKAFIKSEIFGKNDLRIYMETAMLGVKNYPVFYEKRLERTPIMFGFNVPCFKLLDLFAVQLEYLNSPYFNNNLKVLNDGLPLPYLVFGIDSSFSQDSYYDAADTDNWYWSVLLKKNIYKHISISAQFARDHFRTVSSIYWGGPKLVPNEVLIRKDDWYWAAQISMGL